MRRSAAAALALALAGCPAASPSDAGVDAEAVADAPSVDDTSVDAGPAPDASPCGALFGRPNANTGLTEAQCRPACGCGSEAWVSPEFDSFRLELLRRYTLDAPYAEITLDPYLASAPTVPDGAVCAVRVSEIEPYHYTLADYPSSAAAQSEGAYVTHHGICGVCSTLEDFAVYAEQPDLTAPVRDCGIRSRDHAALITCLEALGFTTPCAQIWAFNTEHTRTACGATCLRLLRAPYHEPDGTLNACLQCDEDESGAVFKAIAGRTRRNSGVASAMCRPCSETLPVAHDYPE